MPVPQTHVSQMHHDLKVITMSHT